ncbi:unnamed protein product [Agarophyton chilense]
MTHNAVNKAEDMGIGVLDVTDVELAAGEGGGRTAVSDVGVVGSVVKDGDVGFFEAAKTAKLLMPREVTLGRKGISRALF